ncbi:hypothetical protein JKP88DRAFT_261240 [Tribonema minus]|uniref:EF-hand domain-containing protein n=1 Tax=Tribonema minus TaxID=303371 RepID=A0A835YUC9_9STRA|nr:hypothetical protein JKP88DRAFT_261240 [Tribonema minus]
MQSPSDTDLDVKPPTAVDGAQQTPAPAPEGDESNLTQGQIEAIRLRAMAAKLRAEADALEAEQAAYRAKETERIFRTFDANKDGVVETEELRAGLEALLKRKIAPEAAQRLLDELDANKDGVLQLDELPSASALALQLDNVLVRERDEASSARASAAEAALAAARQEALAALINDKPATPAERALAVLPFILPLTDVVGFGSFLLQGPLKDGNPAVAALLTLAGLLRVVPLGQFGLFLGLSFLGDSLGTNRLIRHNALQAVYLDVALFPASLLLAGITYLTGATAGGAPGPLLEYGSDFVFLAMAAAIVYSVGSTLTGQAPDKVPLISQVVQRRLDRMSAREFNRRDNNEDNKK